MLSATCNAGKQKPVAWCLFLRLQPDLNKAGSRATRLANCHNWPAMLAEQNDRL
jgi:hypothetical protein